MLLHVHWLSGGGCWYVSACLPVAAGLQHWNRSGAPRAAILGNIVPRWVMPHTNEHEPAFDRFVESGQAEETLTPRELRDAANIVRARWGQSHGRDDGVAGGLHTGGKYYARQARDAVAQPQPQPQQTSKL